MSLPASSPSSRHNEIERLEARVQELENALARYGSHDERCANYRHDFRVRFGDTEPTCLCGYQAALTKKGDG